MIFLILRCCSCFTLAVRQLACQPDGLEYTMKALPLPRSAAAHRKIWWCLLRLAVRLNDGQLFLLRRVRCGRRRCCCTIHAACRTASRGPSAGDALAAKKPKRVSQKRAETVCELATENTAWTKLVQAGTTSCHARHRLSSARSGSRVCGISLEFAVSVPLTPPQPHSCAHRRPDCGHDCGASASAPTVVVIISDVDH